MKKISNVFKNIVDYLVPRVVGTFLILALILFGLGTFLTALQWVLKLLGVM